MSINEQDVTTQHIYHGKILDLDINTIILPNGKLAKREIVHHSSSCGAIVVNKDQKLLLVEQWRDPIKAISLEIPAGLIDETDVSPEAAMKRELNEEAGLQAKYWEKVSEFYSSPGFTDEKIYLYYCDTVIGVKHKKAMDKDEFLTCKWYSQAEINDLIATNKILDGKTRYAISIFENMRKFKNK